VLLSTAAFTFSPSVEHIPADVALRRWRSRVFECVYIPVCFDHVLGKEKALNDEKAFFRADPYVASTTLYKHNTAAPVGTGPTSSAVHALLNSARTKSSDTKCSSATFPFGIISPVLYAAGQSLERVANGQKKEVQGVVISQQMRDDQCYQEYRECEQVSMLHAEEAKEEAEKMTKTGVEQGGGATQAPNNQRKQLHLESGADDSHNRFLLLLAPTPLVVNVDAANGKDTMSCVESPTLACKTIRYALEKGQLEAPKQSRSLLEIQVAAGEYLGECSEEGNTVAMAITLKKKAGGEEVLIDCKGAGSLLNITHDASATSELEGLTIANGVSKVGGGAASVRGGRMVLKECVFRQLQSLASGNYVGGGAVSFVVSAVLLKQHSVYRIDRRVDALLTCTFLRRLCCVQGAVSLEIDGCTFTQCTTPSGAGGAIIVRFQTVVAGWVEVGYALTILSSRFERCGAGAAGGAVAAVAEEGVASVTVLVDDTAFDGSWIVSGGTARGNGGAFYFSYWGDAINTNTTIRGSNFTNGIFTSSGGPSGGACYFEYGATVTKAHQQIESCVFRNNTLVGSFVCGGGVAVYMRGEMTEMTFFILLCVFAHNVLQAGERTAYGAGVYMQFYGGAVRSMLLLVERSAFESNVASTSGVGAQAKGAGLKMLVAAEATNMTATITHCTFSSNTVRAEGGDGLAGGAALDLSWQGGATAGGLLTTILDSTFEANRAHSSFYGSNGGAVYVLMVTTNPYSGAVQTVINGCRFLDNAAAGVYGQGGAIYHGTQQAGASLHVLGCTIRGNYASRYGAGIYAEQLTPNPPANLLMVATYYGPTYAPPYSCGPSFTAAGHYAREYKCSSELVIDSGDISNNSAVSEDGAVKADGGAVYAVINARTSKCNYPRTNVCGNYPTSR
jgi:hypothetical protein